jgi:diacylglycerol kinase family enzyme
MALSGPILWSQASMRSANEIADYRAVTPIAHVIINRDSGANDKAALIREIETAFTAHGWRVEFVLAGRGDLYSRTQQTVAQAPGAIVVAGGDGTINAVASACVQANRPLGILPAGTFNYVARNLGVPTEVSQAVSVIVNGHVRHLDIGEINGRIFLHNAGFGLYTQMLERRERDVRRFGRSRMIAFLSGMLSLLSAHPLFAVDLMADGLTERHLTTTLLFGCNPLQMEEVSVAAAECLRQQKLAVLSLKLRSRWEAIVAACAGLIGRLDKVDTTDVFCASSVRVQTRRRALKVVIDGEIVMLRPPLDVSLRPGALQVLAPAVEQG